jgi:putative transcriptional regulator
MAKAIKVNLDLLLVQKKKKLKDLSEEVGITMANLSTLKRGKGKAIRFSTLLALCEALDCTPGDLLELEELTQQSN